MKSLKKILVLLIVIFAIQLNTQAQCSDIYFYRVNNPLLQSERTVYLFQNGEEKARLNLGHRFKATVCTPGQYEFVVKSDPSNISVVKKVIQVEANQNYYLKIACLLVGEVATIDEIPSSKGKKEIAKGSKFTRALGSINLSNAASETTQVEPQIIPSGNIYQEVQISNNFKFEITHITKAGGLLQFEYKITNLSQDDRPLELCPAMTNYYDDLSNLIFPYETCLGNDCEQYSYYSGSKKVMTKYYCNGSSSAVMPSGIPLKARITIKDINDRAKQFLRGTIWFKSENEFRLEYNNIPFPKIVDEKNPNKRNYGTQSIELLDAKRSGNATVFHFKHSNNSTEGYNFKIKGGVVYDDQGNQYKIDGLAFANPDSRVEHKNAYREWQRTINSASTVSIYTFTDNIPNSSKVIPRISLDFENFKLSWNNIEIKKTGNTAIDPSKIRTKTTTRHPNPNYIEYANFKEKVINNENLAGKKIILEKIYFRSGSAELLNNSLSQLDEIADLIQSNPILKMEFSGHTDDVGDETSNMLLSQQRADAIRYHLIKKGINPARITSIGKGETEPISRIQNESGRQQNRRVEIKIIQ